MDPIGTELVKLLLGLKRELILKLDRLILEIEQKQGTLKFTEECIDKAVKQVGDISNKYIPAARPFYSEVLVPKKLNKIPQQVEVIILKPAEISTLINALAGGSIPRRIESGDK